MGCTRTKSPKEYDMIIMRTYSLIVNVCIADSGLYFKLPYIERLYNPNGKFY